VHGTISNAIIAAAGFAGVTALAIAELSATEAFAACTSCLLCRGLFSCGHAVFVHDDDAWLQRRCPAGRIMCAQLPLDSQVWWRWQLPNEARPRHLPHARAVCSAVACFRAALWCLYTMMMRGCGGAAQWGASCVHKLPLDSQVWRRWQLPN
jgi:hypothetical protein